MRHLVTAYSVGISAYASLLFAMMLPSSTQLISSASSMALIPWVLGIYGTVGLIGAWWKPGQESALRLRVQILLLQLGLVGAAIFALIAVGIFLILVSSAATRAEDLPLSAPIFFLGLLLFPGLPAFQALKDIRRMQDVAGQKPLAKGAMHGWFAALLLGPLAVVGIRFAAQETVLWWYGHDLGARAEAAAQSLAQGRPLCLIAADGVTAFAELNGRKLMVRTQQQRDRHRRYAIGVSPHFGIRIDGATYWWSFKSGDYYPEPEYWGGAIPYGFQLTCPD